MHAWHTQLSVEARPCCWQAGNEQAEEDAKRVGHYTSSERVASPQQLAGRLLTTVYMGTVNSSQETKDRAAALARQVLPLCLVAAWHHFTVMVTTSTTYISAASVVMIVLRKHMGGHSYPFSVLEFFHEGGRLCRRSVLITWMSRLTQ